MNNSDNKHCIEHPWGQVWHYKQSPNDGWRACGVQDDPGRIEITPAYSTYPRLAFRMPEQRHDVSNVLKLMEEAYKRGRNDNRTELATLLKKLINV